MSRIRSLEKELDHLAKLKQQREEKLRGSGAGTSPAPSRLAGAPRAAAAAAAAVTAMERSSSASTSGSASDDGSDGSSSCDSNTQSQHSPTYRDAALRVTGSSASSLLFSSPNSTGSRFDLLMDGGGACKRSEVRMATNTTRRKGKPSIGVDGSPHSPKEAVDASDERQAGPSPALSRPPPPSVLLPEPSVTSITIPSQAPFRRLQRQPFSHILVCDFEATCESGSVNYPHEIIEFPVVALDTATLQVVAEFHAYVRPVKNPKLTKFCTELTGITQEMVDAADPLPVVVERFSTWLREVLYPKCRAWAAYYAPESGDSSGGQGKHSEYCAALSNNLRSEQKRFTYDDRTEESKETIPEEKMVCFATDGPWDMRRFMHECSVLRDGIDFPPVCYRYINVRHSFCEHFKSRQIKLTHMLKKLHMGFEGQRHSGIADTRNIARVLAELLARGYRVHHVSTIKYAHRGDAFLASNLAAQELLAEYGEEDMGGRSRQQHSSGGGGGGGKGRENARKHLPRNKQKNPGKGKRKR